MIFRFMSFIFIFIAFDAMAEIYYVSNTGSNADPGTSAEPWQTLQYAADNLSSTTGHTVIVENGLYAPFHVTQDRTVNTRVIFKTRNKLGARITSSESYNSKDASIHVNGDYVTIDGFDVAPTGITAGSFQRGIRASGVLGNFIEGIIIRNNRITGAGLGITTSFANDPLIEYNECRNSVDQHGIYVANSGDRPIIRGNILHHNNFAGLHMNGDASLGDDGIISEAIIENNIIYHNVVGRSSTAAINMDGVQNSIVRNNLIFDESYQGIANFREDGGAGSIGNRILNNTLIMTSSANHALKFRNGSTNGYVRNNILIQQGGTGTALALDVASMPGINSDYNIIIHTVNSALAIENYNGLSAWQNTTGQDTHSFSVTGTSATNILSKIFVNPGTDPSTANYELLANSPALDAGITVTDASLDMNAISRPSGSAYDLGAYEYITGDVMPIPQNVSIIKN